MELKTRCIVLRTISYSDTTSIAVLLTRESGVVSALTPAGHSREANRRRALLLPLSILDCTLAGKNISNLPRLKSLTRTELPEFRDNHVKNISALFITDIIHTLLPETGPDSDLFDFIMSSIIFFAETRNNAEIANFHIAFLVGLQQRLGIAPDLSTYRRGSLFDLNSGFFRSSAPLEGEYLSREESATAFAIGRMTYRNSSLFSLNRAQRNRVLDIILKYYSIHLKDVTKLQSLEVVRALF